MIAIAPSSTNFLWYVVKKSILVTLFVSALSMVMAYSFYQLAFRVSLLPFWITMGISILTILGPGFIVLVDGGKSRMVALGLANLTTLTAIYVFFGVVGFFFYFLFAPMPSYAHVGGLTLGMAMTGYWMVFTAKDVNKALKTSHFLQNAFVDTGAVLQYRLQSMGKLEAAMSSRSPFGKLHMYAVLLIAPLSLVIGRILAPIFGPHGPILLGALILFPVSQWIAGIGIRQYIVMVRLPKIMEHTLGKPVIVVGDDLR